MSDLEGDRNLSCNDRRWWAFQYHLVDKFGICPIFKIQGPYAPHGVDQHVTWFIPKTMRFNEIKNYIMHELKRDNYKGEWLGEGDERHYFPGCVIRVMPYTPNLPYTERDIIEKMVKSYTHQMTKVGIREMVKSWNHKQIRKGILFGAIATFIAVVLSQI